MTSKEKPSPSEQQLVLRAATKIVKILESLPNDGARAKVQSLLSENGR